MEFRLNSNIQINSDFHKNAEGAPQHFFTKVVLIDKRESDVMGKAYQLSPEFLVNPENLRALKERFLMGHYEGVFLPMGDLQKLDRGKKQLRLKSGNVITYEHLIQLTGTGEESEEFIGALEALIDALLVSGRKSVLQALNEVANSGKASAKYDPKTMSIGEKNSSIHPKSLAENSAAKPPSSLDKRFYEFQL